MKEAQHGLLDWVKSGALVAVHIGFGSNRLVKSGELRSFEFDTHTITLHCTDGTFLVPLTSISTIKLLEEKPGLHVL